MKTLSYEKIQKAKVKNIFEQMLPLLRKIDSLNGVIYVCPHCHRYVMADSGIKICKKCGGKVDNDNQVWYKGHVKFDGDDSWEYSGAVSKISKK